MKQNREKSFFTTSSAAKLTALLISHSKRTRKILSNLEILLKPNNNIYKDTKM